MNAATVVESVTRLEVMRHRLRSTAAGSERINLGPGCRHRQLLDVLPNSLNEVRGGDVGVFRDQWHAKVCGSSGDKAVEWIIE